MYVANGTGRLEKVLLSKPNHVHQAEQINEISKNWNLEHIDERRVQKEFHDLHALYESLGISVELMEKDEILPHAVFARDFGGCVNEGYILGKFKNGIRLPETAAYEEKMAELGVPLLGEVSGAGVFEGGDFAFLDERTVAIGMLDRTNAEGFGQITEILKPLGYEVHSVEMDPRYLHLDMCFNLVAPKVAIGYADLPETFVALLKKMEIELITDDEPAIFRHGYNVQAIGRDEVISLVQNRGINEKMRKKGLTVHEVELTELLKLGGGIHCMTFPLRRMNA
nr:arginine deiminase family protein [Trichococcus alkaliphilus]